MFLAQADPAQTTVNTAAAGGVAVVGLIFSLVYLAYVIWLLYCVYKVAVAAGFNGWIAILLMIVPFGGFYNLFQLSKIYTRIGEPALKCLLQFIPIYGPIELTRVAKKLTTVPNLAYSQGTPNF